MVRRILYIAFLVSLVGAIAYFYVSYTRKSNVVMQNNPFIAVPQDAAMICNLNNVQRFAKVFRAKNAMLSDVSKMPVLHNSIASILNMDSILNEQPELAQLLKNSSFTISWHMVGPKRIEPIYVFALNTEDKAEELGSEIRKNTIQGKNIKKYNGVEIRPVSLPRFMKTDLFFFQEQNFVVIGTERLLLEKSIGEIEQGGTLNKNPDFLKVSETSGHHVPINIYVNFSSMSNMVSVWGESGHRKLFKAIKSIGKWMELDVKLTNNAFLLNGFGTNGELNDYFSVLKSQAPVKFTGHNILPLTTKSFVFLGIDNISGYRSRYNSYVHENLDVKEYQIALNRIQKKTGVDAQVFFDGLLEKEICSVWDAGLTDGKDENQLLLFKVKSKREAEAKYREFLTRYAGMRKVSLDHYASEVKIDRKTSIHTYYYPFDNACSLLYGNLVDDEKLSYVTFYDNYMVVANTKTILKSFVLENMRKRTLSIDERFMTFLSNLSEHTSLFWFMNMQNWNDLVDGYFKDDIKNEILGATGSWQNFYALGVQVASLNDLVYSNLYLYYDPNTGNRAQTVWESKLDTDIVLKPTLVTNHYTQEKEICVQDAYYNLYLINNSGIVLWKKKLDYPILGQVHQIDYYKNGKLQLLFNTKKKIYVLDRNGNSIERYPVNLTSDASTGLAVFDYDRKKEYRIFIPCENRKVYLYDKDGNINTGWKFTRTDHLVKQSPQFFRVKNKDYIVLKDKARLYILDRRGAVRVKLKQQFNPSVNNVLYFDRNIKEGKPRLVTSAANGAIKYVYFDGTVKESLFNQCEPSHYYLNSDLDGDGVAEHVFVDDNTLHIYEGAGQTRFSHTFDGNITIKPRLYHFARNNVKIGVTDQAYNKFYLFGNSGEMYSGFPLSGKTEFSIGFLNQTGYRFNLLVGGRNGFLLNYMVK